MKQESDYTQEMAVKFALWLAESDQIKINKKNANRLYKSFVVCYYSDFLKKATKNE